jgi:hypothetical protein
MPVGKIPYLEAFLQAASGVSRDYSFRLRGVVAPTFYRKKIKTKSYCWYPQRRFTDIWILMQHEIVMGYLDVTSVLTCSRRCLEEKLNALAQTLNGKNLKPLCLQPPQYPQPWNVISPWNASAQNCGY